MPVRRPSLARVAFCLFLEQKASHPRGPTHTVLCRRSDGRRESEWVRASRSLLEKLHSVVNQILVIFVPKYPSSTLSYILPFISTSFVKKSEPENVCGRVYTIERSLALARNVAPGPNYAQSHISVNFQAFLVFISALDAKKSIMLFKIKVWHFVNLNYIA